MEVLKKVVRAMTTRKEKDHNHNKNNDDRVEVRV